MNFNVGENVLLKSSPLTGIYQGESYNRLVVQKISISQMRDKCACKASSFYNHWILAIKAEVPKLMEKFDK